jgi:hypothetical protein
MGNKYTEPRGSHPALTFIAPPLVIQRSEATWDLLFASHLPATSRSPESSRVAAPRTQS